MLVLDTDHVTFLEEGTGEEYQRLLERLKAIPAQERTSTIITFEEQTRGWLGYVARARTLAREINAYRKLNRHLDTFRRIKVLEFDERAAAVYQGLRESRLRVGTMDLKIAAIALANNATLLTRNLTDFVKVPGLRAEGWSA